MTEGVVMAHYALTASGKSDLDAVHRGPLTECQICADLLWTGRIEGVNQNSDTPNGLPDELVLHMVEVSGLTLQSLVNMVMRGDVPSHAVVSTNAQGAPIAAWVEDQ